MSQMGQSRHCDRAPLTSGFSQLADILRVSRHVSNVPQADMASVAHHLDRSVPLSRAPLPTFAASRFLLN
jgi:hypothetical protein